MTITLAQREPICPLCKLPSPDVYERIGNRDPICMECSQPIKRDGKIPYPIGVSQREQARDIITEFRKTIPRLQLAKLIGICPSYVSFAMKMTKRSGNYSQIYLLPEEALEKILTFGLRSEVLL